MRDRIGQALRRVLNQRGNPGTTFTGVVASSFVGGLSLVVGIFLLPIVANSVGAGPYGLWLFLVTLTSVVGYGDLGVYSAIVHYGSQTRAGIGRYSMSQLMTAGVFWSVIVAAVVVPIYAVLAWLYARSHGEGLGLSGDTLALLVALGGTVAALAVARPFGGALVGHGHLLLAKRADLIALVFRLAGTLVAAVHFKSIVAVAIVETIATALPSLIVIPFVLRRIAPLSISRDAMRPLGMMLAYSAKSLVTSLPLTVVTSGATIVLGLVQGPTQVTYFNFAYRISSGLRTVLGWTLEPFRSALSRIAAEDDRLHRSTVNSLGFAAFTVVGAITGLIGVSAFWLVRIWVGDAMPADIIAATAIILMCGLVAESLINPLMLAGDTVGRPGILLMPQVLWAALFLVLSPWFGTLWGTVGVAIAVSGPLLVAVPYCAHVARRKLDFSLSRWWTDAIAPALLLIIPALVLSLVTLWTVGSIAPWAAAMVFAVVGLATFVQRRHHLPIADLVSALRLRM